MVIVIDIMLKFKRRLNHFHFSVPIKILLNCMFTITPVFETKRKGRYFKNMYIFRLLEDC